MYAFCCLAIGFFIADFHSQEDFGLKNASRILQKWQSKHAVFNDDIQGTGCTALSALRAAVHVSKIPMNELRIVCFGAGSAGIGIVEQVAKAIALESKISLDEARKHFWYAPPSTIQKSPLTQTQVRRPPGPPPQIPQRRPHPRPAPLRAPRRRMDQHSAHLPPRRRARRKAPRPHRLLHETQSLLRGCNPRNGDSRLQAHRPAPQQPNAPVRGRPKGRERVDGRTRPHGHGLAVPTC